METTARMIGASVFDSRLPFRSDASGVGRGRVAACARGSFWWTLGHPFLGCSSLQLMSFFPAPRSFSCLLSPSLIAAGISSSCLVRVLYDFPIFLAAPTMAEIPVFCDEPLCRWPSSVPLDRRKDHARSLRSPLRGVCHLPLLGAGFCASLVAAPLLFLPCQVLGVAASRG